MAKPTTDREFAYYLQGAFEIGGLSVIDAAAESRILRVILNLDEKGEAALGTLSILEKAGSPEQKGQELAAFLNGHFVHEIDPDYDGDNRDHLQKVHDGRGTRADMPRRPIETLC